MIRRRMGKTLHFSTRVHGFYHSAGLFTAIRNLLLAVDSDITSLRVIKKKK